MAATVKHKGLYRKKPIIIQAEQTKVRVVIKTLEGDMVANPGDWIITGVEGEKYPCKPDIFAKTYEKVSGVDVGAAVASKIKAPVYVPCDCLKTGGTTACEKCGGRTMVRKDARGR